MKKVLITGGTGGIGLALARCYAREHAEILLVARDEKKLADAEPVLREAGAASVRCLAGDLTEAATVPSLAALAADTDVLVNCAGTGRTGAALVGSMEADEKMVELNCTALMTLCRLIGRRMAARGSGLIINVSSTGAFQPGPYTACYYATKAFVLSYSRALAEELRPYGVRVCCACPGPVRTDFYQKSGGAMPHTAMSADRTAACILKQAEKKTVVICGLRNRVLLILPSWLRMKAVGVLKRRALRTDHAGKSETC